jgi:transcriptional regulator with XRE-family HTH domain
MLSLIANPKDVCLELAAREKKLRLGLGWTQKELARRAGLALPTLRHFERTGQISLERLVMIASTFRATDSLEGIFQPPVANSLEEIEQRQKVRRRGRRTKR